MQVSREEFEELVARVERAERRADQMASLHDQRRVEVLDILVELKDKLAGDRRSLEDAVDRLIGKMEEVRAEDTATDRP